MKDSKLFSLNLKDLLKGLLLAILTPAILIIEQSLEAGTLVFNWNHILMASLAGGVAYLVKNFFTPPTEQALKSTDEENPNGLTVGGRPNDRNP